MPWHFKLGTAKMWFKNSQIRTASKYDNTIEEQIANFAQNPV
jgi:hypothetical protein